MKDSSKALFIATCLAIIVICGFMYMINENKPPTDNSGLNVDDYEYRLIRTDGLSTEFYLNFYADRPGEVSAYLDGVGILINGRSSVSFDAGTNSIRCEINSVGLSGVTLLNSLDLRFN